MFEKIKQRLCSRNEVERKLKSVRIKTPLVEIETNKVEWKEILIIAMVLSTVIIAIIINKI